MHFAICGNHDGRNTCFQEGRLCFHWAMSAADSWVLFSSTFYWFPKGFIWALDSFSHHHLFNLYFLGGFLQGCNFLFNLKIFNRCIITDAAVVYNCTSELKIWVVTFVISYDFWLSQHLLFSAKMWSLLISAFLLWWLVLSF